MASKREKIAGELPEGIIEKTNVRFDIKTALKFYRYLKAFCDNAVDSVDWYIGGQKIPTYIAAIAQSRAETFTILTHIDSALNTFYRLCEASGEERKANIIKRKFVDPLGGSDGRGKPFSNEALAELFDVDERTIQRDISDAYKKLSILFFGANGV